ncbi:MAG TPA: YceI family protein [Flavobacteriaceae bacterium]|nr:YceI family protein [Flavobacteriaceae bacterium]
MKNILLFAFLTFITGNAQTKYLTKTGEIRFEASVPSFEEVAAKNNTATAILDLESGEFAALVLIKGFRFKNALMEEHFNENYAESEKYPKATFKGQLEEFETASLKTSYTLTGKLTFHGVTNTLEVKNVSLTKNGDSYELSGRFVTYPADFAISIPKIVRNKIADSVTVFFTFTMIAK